MAVPGDKCGRCEYCGKELTDDLEVFCLIPWKDPSVNICWCVCQECKADFLKGLSAKQE